MCINSIFTFKKDCFLFQRISFTFFSNFFFYKKNINKCTRVIIIRTSLLTCFFLLINEYWHNNITSILWKLNMLTKNVVFFLNFKKILDVKALINLINRIRFRINFFFCIFIILRSSLLQSFHFFFVKKNSFCSDLSFQLQILVFTAMVGFITPKQSQRKSLQLEY